RLHRHARARSLRDVDDDRPCLGGGRRVVHVAPEPLDVADQGLEVPIQALERRLLDRARLVAQRLALGEARERLAAQTDELGRGDRERFLEKRVLHRAARALAKWCRQLGVAHRPPSRSSARWSARTRDFARVSPPPICMRQPASHATRQSAPVDSTFASFLARICEETSGSRTENEPPKPQHSSAPGSGTNSAPLRLPRSLRGLSDSWSPRRRWHESWYVTRPGTAEVNSVTPSTRTRNCESSWVRTASSTAPRATVVSARSPGYSCFTIQAHDPNGTTTCSASRNSSTVRRATAAASA